MSRYHTLTPNKDGWSDWVHFPRKFKHQCCECGNKHLVQMKLDSRGKIWMRWKTDNRGRRPEPLI